MLRNKYLRRKLNRILSIRVWEFSPVREYPVSYFEVKKEESCGRIVYVDKDTGYFWTLGEMVEMIQELFLSTTHTVKCINKTFEVETPVCVEVHEDTSFLFRSKYDK